MIELQGDAGIIFRDGLIKNLAAGKLEVTFTKKDGSERKMICTRSNEIIPFNEESEKWKQSNSPDNLPVWDVEAHGWRAFRIDRITGVAFVLTEIETI
jgi:hypothetical protein